MKHYLLICSLFWVATLQAQFQDAFNELVIKPVWMGDDSVFQINAAEQLQLHASQAGQAFIAAKISPSQEMEWTCKIINAFSPSTQNFCRYYLLSDSMNLKGALNGYYVQLGGSTGNSDSIGLYQQIGSIRKRLIGGRPSTFSKSSNKVMLRVRRSNLGVWTLETDTSVKSNYILEGSFLDNTPFYSGYMGIDCHFTSGNVTSFYLDDVYAGPWLRDSLAPVVDEVKIIDAQHFSCHFDEAVTMLSALDPNHYYLSNPPSFASKVEKDSTDEMLFTITFSIPIKERIASELIVSEVQDFSGNEMSGQHIPICMFHPQIDDVLITEFMPDPQPPIDLPDQEFIELYNNSTVPIDLFNWQITDGNSHAYFPHIIIPSNSFLILCATANVQLFKAFGEVLGHDYFPSLNNSGDHLWLFDYNGQLIHEVSYDLNTYQDEEKAAGGWSIELKKLNQRCRGLRNFTASFNAAGGTPGRSNATWLMQEDSSKISITCITLMNDTMLCIAFNETLDSMSLIQADIDLSIGEELKREVLGKHHDTLLVYFKGSPINVMQTISLGGVQSCTGILAGELIGSWIRLQPEKAERYDILIHEIMADPDGNSGEIISEYIELINRTEKVIALDNWTLSDGHSTCSLLNNYLLPGELLLVVPNSACDDFKSAKKACVGAFLSLGNDEDLLILRNQDGHVIHAIQYNKSWYHDAMKANGGFSLEMLDTSKPCMGAENWHACMDVKGGTPGWINSQFEQVNDLTSPFIVDAYPLNQKTVRVTFNEPVEISKGFGDTLKFDSIKLIEPMFNQVYVYLKEGLQPDVKYAYKMNGIHDCTDQVMGSTEFLCALPDTVLYGDLIINEILFHPYPEGADFVEIYNKSTKVLDLKDLIIANADKNDSLNEMIQPLGQGKLIFPDQYMAFSSKPNLITNFYHVALPNNLIACELPAYHSDKGKCMLFNQQLFLDAINYNEKMHFALITDPIGVSLERISTTASSEELSNWTSCASTSGYATPTSVNSQRLDNIKNHHERLSVEPKVFSPDNDGFNDLVVFDFSLPGVGFTGTLKIYDASGYMIKQLMNNKLLGEKGTMYWDGIGDQGKRVANGIYIAVFTWYNLQGETGTQAKCIAVAGDSD